jgi:hypothetical protein
MIGSMKDVAELLYLKQHSLQPSFPDDAAELNIPVTDASAERLFSKLKLINYLTP